MAAQLIDFNPMDNRRCIVYQYTHSVLKALKEKCPMRIRIHIGRSVAAIHFAALEGNQELRYRKHLPCFPHGSQAAKPICVSIFSGDPQWFEKSGPVRMTGA